jgi:hypothetical protein
MSNPDRSILKATLGLTPFISSCTITYQWLKLWPDIVSDHLSYFMLFVGFLFGHQVGRMITCHVTKMRFPYTNIPVNIILTSGYLLAKFEPQISK